MQITMNVTRYGSENGFQVRLFKKHQSYDVAHTLATRFIANGYAIATKYKEESDVTLEETFKDPNDRAEMRDIVGQCEQINRKASMEPWEVMKAAMDEIFPLTGVIPPKEDKCS